MNQQPRPNVCAISLQRFLLNIGWRILISSLLEYRAVWSVVIQLTFRGNCRLHLQGRRIIQARSQHEARIKQNWVPVCFILLSWSWGRNFPPNLVDFQLTTRRYIPGNWTLPNYCFESLISYCFDFGLVFVSVSICSIDNSKWNCSAHIFTLSPPTKITICCLGPDTQDINVVIDHAFMRK
jgi:hypothetical protein